MFDGEIRRLFGLKGDFDGFPKSNRHRRTGSPGERVIAPGLPISGHLHLDRHGVETRNLLTRHGGAVIQAHGQGPA